MVVELFLALLVRFEYLLVVFVDFIKLFVEFFVTRLQIFLGLLGVREHEHAERVQIRHMLHELIAFQVQLGLALVDELGLLTVDLAVLPLEHSHDEVDAEYQLE